MITIAVVDLSADSRSRLVEQIGGYLRESTLALTVLPRVNLKPVTLQELQFMAAPEVCILGSELASRSIMEIAAVKKIFPETSILVEVPGSGEDFALLEQLARLGADDTFSGYTTAPEFFKKVILLTRRVMKQRSGTMILVDGGKGGVGVTTVAAGLAEALVDQKKRVCLIDFDFETQDLSRFLQTRPFVNENLHLLLSQSRPVVSETVEQCLVRLWADEERFSVMPPSPEMDEVYDPRSGVIRTILSILETLDVTFDCVVIDAGSIRGALRQTLYRVVDKVVFVANNDPATLYSSVDRVSRMMGIMGPAGQVILAENGSTSHGLPSKLFRAEFARATKLSDEAWLSSEIPWCKSGARWPGSGGTIFSQGKDGVSRALIELGAKLGILDAPAEARSFKLPTSFFRRKSRSEVPLLPLRGVKAELMVTGGQSKGEQLALPKPSTVSHHELPLAPARAIESELDVRSFIREAKVI